MQTLPLNQNHSPSIRVVKHDLPEDFLRQAQEVGFVAWDIETSGLDWRTERIGTCQLHVPGGDIVVVQIDDQRPDILLTLLEDGGVTKLFHHAMFDLRFMAYHWQANPQTIACTKIAAKLLDKQCDKQNSLRLLLADYLGITIDKTQQTSNWLDADLNSQQIEYATRDVLYLPDLYARLAERLSESDLLSLALHCFAHLPTRTQLDISGYCDVYTY